MARWEKHGTTSNTTLAFLHYFTASLQFVGPLIYPIKALIEVLEFRIWSNKKFGDITHFKSKHDLLDSLIKRANLQPSNSEEGVFIAEFGVAFGETTKYLISRIKVPFQYHGFDTFEGLPNAWRRLPAGAMTSDGKLPKILGEDIYFHKGLVQDTIGQVNFQSSLLKVFIFDLDLYGPTLFAFKHVLPNMRIGDIVYFDEAFDSEERIIIENYFLDKFEFEVIGASPFGLAFEIKKSKV